MRYGFPALLLMLSPSLALASEPQSIGEIESAIASTQSELEANARQIKQSKQDIRQLSHELNTLENKSARLDASRVKAKKALDHQYSLMLDNPDVDITSAQRAYQDSWAEVKQNQQQRLEADQKLTEENTGLSALKAEESRIKGVLDNLQSGHLRARAQRLQSELSQSDELKVSFTNVCQMDLTLAQCDKQTQNLAMQKAVNQFQTQLIDQTTESGLVKQNLGKASLNIHVLNHKTSKSGFYDGKRYQKVLDVTLESRPSKNTACKLLGIESGYCFEQSDLSQQSKQQQEIRWVSLTVRSNQHQDNVVIDNVNYGSTPVEIMLPTGLHMITVEKEGYKSFHQELKIQGDHSLRAVLREKLNLPQAGERFADQIKSGSKAPQMVVVTSGEYLIGENGSQQVNLDHAFGISATPVTVDQFATFVNHTGYQSDAELKKLCSTIENAVTVPVKGSYWRNPGYKQSQDFPAVCLSRNDARAYTKWLSAQTGHNYRLPTSSEWEVAARGGSKQAFWWGERFGSGEANTGWSGTPWSNKSASPVRAFAPNSYGLYDMVGNVWEWTAQNSGIVKGGAWSFAPAKAAAYESLDVSPNTTANFIGFRVVRDLK